MTKEEWLRNSVDMDRLVVASKIKDTVYLGTVNDFIVNPKLRKHFADTLGIPVFYEPVLKTKEGYVAKASTGRKEGRLGQHINLTKKANENTFIHELVHVQQGLRGRGGNEVTAKKAGANLLDSYYESMIKKEPKRGAWATEFMEGYRQMGKANFMYPKTDRVIDGVSINLSDYEENDKVIKVWTITAMVRGQGGGSKVLEKLKALADETKTSIVLKPGAWGLVPVLTVPQLKEWYMRHGFKEMKNGWLIYKPKGVVVKVNLEKHLGAGFWAKRTKRKVSSKPRAGRVR